MIARGLEPLADALVHSGDPEACATEVGRSLATDGVELNQVLDDLHATYTAVGAGPPAFQVVRAICMGWSEVSLQYLHGLSCEDPLTGLASLAHLRSRLDELQRAAERRGDEVSGSYALVVVELDPPVHRRPGPAPLRSAAETSSARFSTSLRMMEVAEAMRRTFSGGETLARTSGRRAVALVPREVSLGTSVESLRHLLDTSSADPQGGERSRVWIESLPTNSELVSALLDELAR